MDATTTPTKTTDATAPLPPEWLYAASDMLRAVENDDDDDDDGDDATAAIVAASTCLPMCELDCTDGALYYHVLGAWCVPWEKVPKAPFLRAWFALARIARAALIERYRYFPKELDANFWVENMLGRDDGDMFAAMRYKDLCTGLLASTTAILASYKMTAWWGSSLFHVLGAQPMQFQHDDTTTIGDEHPTNHHAGTMCTLHAIARVIAVSGACACLERWAARQGWADNGDWLYWLHYYRTKNNTKRGAASRQLSELSELSDAVAERGHTGMLRLLRARDFPFSDEIGFIAATHTPDDADTNPCLEYLSSIGFPCKNPCAASKAADRSTPNYLVYLRGLGCPWDSRAAKTAAANGRFACLKYLREHGCPWDDDTTTAAAAGGHLACLAYLREHGCPWTSAAAAAAAANGRLACLEYLWEQGCPWNADTILSAATHGHLACIAFAQQNGCPWNKVCCRQAVMHGHVACLQYMRERGCPWDKVNCLLATYDDTRPAMSWWYETPVFVVHSRNSVQGDRQEMRHWIADNWYD